MSKSDYPVTCGSKTNIVTLTQTRHMIILHSVLYRTSSGLIDTLNDHERRAIYNIEYTLQLNRAH